MVFAIGSVGVSIHAAVIAESAVPSADKDIPTLVALLSSSGGKDSEMGKVSGMIAVGAW